MVNKLELEMEKEARIEEFLTSFKRLLCLGSKLDIFKKIWYDLTLTQNLKDSFCILSLKIKVLNLSNAFKVLHAFVLACLLVVRGYFLRVATCLWTCDFARPGFILGRSTQNSTLGCIEQWLPVYF